MSSAINLCLLPTAEYEQKALELNLDLQQQIKTLDSMKAEHQQITQGENMTGIQDPQLSYASMSNARNFACCRSNITELALDSEACATCCNYQQHQLMATLSAVQTPTR